MKLALDLDQVQLNAGILPPENVGSLISKIFTGYIFYAAGIGLLIYLVMGGYQMMTSRGDPKAIEMARGKITNALLGFVLVIMAYFITSLIGQIFGIGAFSEIFNN